MQSRIGILQTDNCKNMRNLYILTILFALIFFNTGCLKEEKHKEYILSVIMNGKEYKAELPKEERFAYIDVSDVPLDEYAFLFSVYISSSKKESYCLRISHIADEPFEINKRYDISCPYDGWNNGLLNGGIFHQMISGWMEFYTIEADKGKIYVYGTFSMILEGDEEGEEIYLEKGVFGPMKISNGYEKVFW